MPSRCPPARSVFGDSSLGDDVRRVFTSRGAMVARCTIAFGIGGMRWWRSARWEWWLVRPKSRRTSSRSCAQGPRGRPRPAPPGRRVRYSQRSATAVAIRRRIPIIASRSTEAFRPAASPICPMAIPSGATPRRAAHARPRALQTTQPRCRSGIALGEHGLRNARSASTLADVSRDRDFLVNGHERPWGGGLEAAQQFHRERAADFAEGTCQAERDVFVE